MSGELGKDQFFRDQYAGGLKSDPEVEAALGGPNTPRISMPPATQPLGGQPWMNQGALKLR